MSDPGEALRQRASECEQKAALTIDETQRRSFLELARAWREMAADYEELSKKQAENSPQYIAASDSAHPLRRERKLDARLDGDDAGVCTCHTVDVSPRVQTPGAFFALIATTLPEGSSHS